MSAKRVNIDSVDVSAADIARIPADNVRVPQVANGILGLKTGPWRLARDGHPPLECR